MRQTKETLAFFDEVNALEGDARDAYARVIKMLIKCFSEDAKAVVVFSHKEDIAKVLALNCEEIEAAQMLHGLREYLDFAVTSNAPPKEMFN